MPNSYFATYVPLLMQIVLAIIIGGAIVTLSALLGKHRYNQFKMGAYECGMTPVGDARGRFSVKFYMVAMLFILFDVEAIFLIPWAVVFRDLRGITGNKYFGFWEMLIYIGIVLVGFFYIWKKGVLDWNKPERADL
jgi:NADH-quinone oxidoreductase subunit A